jgi:hypothetical protein
MRTEFKEGDYIVVLKLGSITTDCAKENYCFKQREDDEWLTPVRDLIGCGNNANRTLKFDKSDKLLDWRYATDEEITEYDDIGEPYEVTPVDSLPPQYIVATTNAEETNTVATHIKGYRTDYIRYGYVICHDGLLDANKKDSNIWDRIPNEVEHLRILSYKKWFNLAHPTNTIPKYVKAIDYGPNWNGKIFDTDIFHNLGSTPWHDILTVCGRLKDGSFIVSTKEEFEKQNINKQVMTKQKLTVPVTDVLEIHGIACINWKETIAGKYLPRVDKDQNITFNQEEVDAMFKAATVSQLPILESIFGKQVKETTLKEMANGKPLFREDSEPLGKAGMIEVRSDFEYKDKAFWLNRAYNWELKSDNEGALCLIPTPKQ